MKWFNFFGLAVVLIMLIPNTAYAMRSKNMPKTAYVSKFWEIVEKIGRFGCIFFMIVDFTHFNFWFHHGRTVYFFVNGGLCLLYYLFWLVCWKQNGRFKALTLSTIPTLIFLSCGILLGYIPLIVCAVLFGVSHIFISYKNAVFSR